MEEFQVGSDNLINVSKVTQATEWGTEWQRPERIFFMPLNAKKRKHS